MVVVAHPDDETVALGARLGRFGAAHFIHVTDGAPRNQYDSRAHGFSSTREYHLARLGELNDVFRSAGIAQVSRECLGITDQEATLHLVEITREIARRIQQNKPEGWPPRLRCMRVCGASRGRAASRSAGVH